jgi:hypothetical protein
MSKLIPFKYAVVQFHRNPVRGEPFNLGLLVVSDHDQVFVKFDTNIKSALKLDPVEYQAVEACLSQIREIMQTAAGNLSFLDKISGYYTGKIQLTEIRGGLAEDVLTEGDSLFQTFVAHPHASSEQGPRRGFAKDLKQILSENRLLGKGKVQARYTIALNENDFVKLDFGYALNAGHVAIEAVDLTLPGREERLEEVGSAAGKFQFLHDQLKDRVRRFAAVKINGVDASWEFNHIKESSDEVFDIGSEKQKLIVQIEQHLTTH